MTDNTAATLKKAWAEDARWKGIQRPYGPEDVMRLRGTVQIYKDCEPIEVPVKFQEHLHELIQKRWKERHSDEE